MEFLGYFEEEPVRTNTGKWGYVELGFPDDYAFNDATSKLFKGVEDNDCKFIAASPDNTRFFIELLDVRFNSQEKTMRIWPHSFKQVKK